jgi:hypothetical protein
MYKNVVLSSVLLAGLGACVTPETVNWNDAQNGVVFYGERLENAGTYYYVENTTSEPRCAAWTNYAGQTPTWFRLAPQEKRMLGQGVVILEIYSNPNLARC